MHILFLVDPLAAPSRDQDDDGAAHSASKDKDWSSNALVRLMMRLSLLSNNLGPSLVVNECAVKFLSVQETVLNHLEFARRFQHDWTLNGDFFEPWTEGHFDLLVNELYIVQNHQQQSAGHHQQQENKATELGEAIQLAAHRSFVEAGRTTNPEQEHALVILIAPLMKGARGMCPSIEALCTSPSFPTKLKFIWLDSTEISSPLEWTTQERQEERRIVNGLFKREGGGGAMVLSLEHVMFCEKLGIQLDTVIQAGCCSRPRRSTKEDPEQAKKPIVFQKTSASKKHNKKKKVSDNEEEDDDDKKVCMKTMPRSMRKNKTTVEEDDMYKKKTSLTKQKKVVKSGEVVTPTTEVVASSSLTKKNSVNSGSESDDDESMDEERVKISKKKSTPKKKKAVVVHDDDDDSSEEEEKMKKKTTRTKKKTTRPTTGVSPQIEEDKIQVMDMSCLKDIVTLTSSDEEARVVTLTSTKTLDEFPVKCLLKGPFAYVVCRDAISAQFLTSLMADKKMACDATSYFLVPTSAGFATLFLDEQALLPGNCDQVPVSEVQQIVVDTHSPLANIGTEQVPTIVVDERVGQGDRSRSPFLVQDQIQSSVIVEAPRCVDGRASPVLENMWWRPVCSTKHEETHKVLPQGRRRVSCVPRVSDSDMYRRLMTSFAHGIDDVAQSSPAMMDVVVTDENVDESTKVRQACDAFLEKVMETSQKDWSERATLLDTIIRTVDDDMSLRDELVGKLRRSPSGIDLAVVMSVRLGGHDVVALRRMLFSLLGHMSLSWRDPLRFSTFLTDVLQGECPPDIYGDIQRIFLDEEEAQPPTYEPPSPQVISSLPKRRTQVMPPPPLFSRKSEEAVVTKSLIPAIPLVSSSKKRVVLNHFVAEQLSNPGLKFRTVEVPVHAPLQKTSSSSSSSMTTAATIAAKSKLVMKKASTFGGVSSLKRSVAMTPGMDVKRVRQAQVQETPVYVQATPHRSLGRSKTFGGTSGGARAAKQLAFTPTSGSSSSMLLPTSVPSMKGGAAAAASAVARPPPAFRRI